MLQGAGAYGILVLRSAQAAAETGAGTFRIGGDVEAVRQASATEARLELVLVSGERLRIGAGVDGTTLRMVLEVLRA